MSAPSPFAYVVLEKPFIFPPYVPRSNIPYTAIIEEAKRISEILKCMPSDSSSVQDQREELRRLLVLLLGDMDNRISELASGWPGCGPTIIRSIKQAVFILSNCQPHQVEMIDRIREQIVARLQLLDHEWPQPI